MSTVYIGIDNGVSGSVGIVADSGVVVGFFPTPTFKAQDYTQRAKNISRVATEELRLRLCTVAGDYQECRVFIERPMVNPGRFMATASALRALEATLVVVEGLLWSVQFIDSRKWQKEFLPAGLHGADLKQVSVDVGCRMWPTLKEPIVRQGDADALFIAEWARRARR